MVDSIIRQKKNKGNMKIVSFVSFHFNLEHYLKRHITLTEISKEAKIHRNLLSKMSNGFDGQSGSLNVITRLINFGVNKITDKDPKEAFNLVSNWLFIDSELKEKADNIYLQN